jgi:tetratricopeptide (TPR) repeat protein
MMRTLLLAIVVSLASAPAWAQDAVFDSYMASAAKASAKRDYAGAEKFLKLAEAEAEEDATKLAKVCGARAAVEEALFKYAEAEADRKKELAHAEETSQGTREGRLRVALLQTLLANHYRMRGMHNEAGDLYKKALATREKLNGSKAWETAQLLRDIADNHRDAGRYDAAEPIYRKAISIVTGMEGREFHLAFCLANLGELRLRQDRPEEAEALCRQALDIYEKAKGKFPFNLALCHGTLGEALRRQNKGTEAAVVFGQALKLIGDGPYSPRLFVLVRDAAGCLRQQGEGAVAARLEAKLKEFEEKHQKANSAKRAR